MSALVAFLALVVCSHGVPLPAGMPEALLDEGGASPLDAAPPAVVASDVAANPEAHPASTEKSWHPFIDKAPKSALKKGRTFLPKTAAQFRAPTSMKDQGEAKVERALKKAEDIHRPSMYMQKEMATSKLREIGEDAKKTSSEWPQGKPRHYLVKKHASPEWPLGKPTFKVSKHALQLKSKRIWQDGKPPQPQGEEVLLEEQQGGDRQSDDDYDPIQDMLAANGWSRDVLTRTNPSPPSEEAETHKVDEAHHSNNHHSSQQQDESGDDDDDAKDLGESAAVEEEYKASPPVVRPRVSKASGPKKSVGSHSHINKAKAKKDFDTSRTIAIQKHEGDAEDDLLSTSSEDVDGADAP